jgi:signal transduction histidine kinase
MQIEHSDFQDQLIRGLAHRMNNVLTLFHGYIGLLLDEKGLSKSTVGGLQKIQDGARAASDLMDRTHSVVRPLKVVCREIKPGDFVRMLRPSFDAIRGPKTQLEIECDDDLPLIRIDAAGLRAAIFELGRNALEATVPTGGTVRIHVSAATRPPGNHARQAASWISISVADDGPGIADDIRDRIFHPFFTTKKKQNAAGLGLTIAASFAEQHGGVLKFESGKTGATFQILLPA